MKQKQYSRSFKQRMIQRMLGPGKVSARALSREVGVSQPTLSLWLKSAGRVPVVSEDEETKARAVRPGDWTPQQKLAAVTEAESLSDSELGPWLRRKGVTEEHLRQWREAAVAGLSARRSQAGSQDSKRVRDLERELRRKDKALAETAALLVLQGKMQALWGAEGASTRQSSDVPSSQASRRRKLRGRD